MVNNYESEPHIQREFSLHNPLLYHFPCQGVPHWRVKSSGVDRVKSISALSAHSAVKGLMKFSFPGETVVMKLLPKQSCALSMRGPPYLPRIRCSDSYSWFLSLRRWHNLASSGNALWQLGCNHIRTSRCDHFGNLWKDSPTRWAMILWRRTTKGKSVFYLSF